MYDVRCEKPGMEDLKCFSELKRFRLIFSVILGIYFYNKYVIWYSKIFLYVCCMFIDFTGIKT